MSLRPRSDYVVIQPIKPSNVSKGGVILPDYTESLQRGIVLSVGPEVKNLEVDEEVLFRPYSSTAFEDVDGIVLIIQEGDIHAVVS